jgi:phosphatidylglycerophosphatase C
MMAEMTNLKSVSVNLHRRGEDTDMGSAIMQCQSGATFRPLVAFDFDGTLTSRDSFLAFLAWNAGPARFALGMARLAGATAAYARDRDRGRLKAAMVREFLKGLSRDDLANRARKFAASQSRRLLRPDAVRRFRAWKDSHALVVIVTASPEILVWPIARGLGADRLIGTRLAMGSDDRVTGHLDGPNCRGAEKVERLRAAFGDQVRLEAAYGDSDGDLEMLALAEERGMKVFGERP